MDHGDRNWERVRRYFILQKWETRLAYALVLVELISMTWFFVTGHPVKAVVSLIMAAVCLWIARWLPPLIKFDDGSDER